MTCGHISAETMIARALKSFTVLMCGLRKDPIDFAAFRVMSNCALLTLLFYFHFTIILIYHVFSYNQHLSLLLVM